MKIRSLIFILFLINFIWAKDVTKDLSKNHPFFESSIGIKQIDQVIKQLETHSGDIPPEIERLAIYKIKTNPKDFSPGVTSYIQGRIETTLKEKARVGVVSPPELKTIKVISTDTSLSLSNTIPTIEELWKLGDKLRIDAFLEGSASKTKDGDVLLNLKLIKHRTAEILWSVNLLAGPNKIEPSMFDLNWSISVPIRIYLVEQFVQKTTVLNDMRLDEISFTGHVSDALTANKRLYWTIQSGFSYIILAKDDTTKIDMSRIAAMSIGVHVTAVIVQKKNRERGYWLGTYMGGRWNLPFSFTPSFPTLMFGYKAQISRRFGISLGILFLPTQKRLSGTGTIPGSDGVFIDVQGLAYEMDLLNYTF